MDQVKVAYLLLRFPCVTETFVAEEMQKIQTAGVKVCLYSLLKPRDKLVHPVSKSLMPLVRYAPGLHHPGLWLAQLHYCARSPRDYFYSLKTLLMQPAPAFSFRLKRLIVFLKAAWIARDLEKQSVQLIHTHFAWLSAGASWVVSRRLQVPFTVTTHAFDIYSEKNDLLLLATHHATRVITISEENKRAMLQLNRSLLAEKIAVIHCGIDLHFFQPEGMARLSVNQPLQITSVGSLIEKKGHEYLIRACGELKAQGLDFHCTIIGGGNLEPQLRALINDLQLENNITLAGMQSQVWVKNRLNQSDVFVLACVNAGDIDGIPVSLMEALAMGIPVITTPVSGITELINHEQTGLLVHERDSSGLAMAITRVAQDQSLRQILKKRGRDLVEQEYDIVMNVNRLKQIFNEVVEERA